MAERNSNGVQDTGNPVLDSVVNILLAGDARLGEIIEWAPRVHAAILEIALKEPGGLRTHADTQVTR